MAAYQYAEDLFAAAEAKDEMPFFIILDELEDPMRTADSVGAHGIIIPKRVVRVTNMVRTMEELQKRGFLEQMRKVVAITGRWM
ncbi:Putative TrmH family tRNA/rRNA methyltransferase YacO [Listeria monocytogenes]|nr:Putative TrmH family tRNA/rRNA methyltransferase YacO [Listeria monocytogenes]